MNFNNETRARINEIINRVRLNSVQGRFVNEEHIHLTVEFLGEVKSDSLGLIKGIMDGLDFEPFTLSLTKAGYFKRREGNIYWLGIKHNDILGKIHKKLHRSLIDKGFELEDREYKPHITIGRKVKLKDGFSTDELDDIAREIEINIDRVDLMKSEFTDGKLIYSVVYSKQSV